MCCKNFAFYTVIMDFSRTYIRPYHSRGHKWNLKGPNPIQNSQPCPPPSLALNANLLFIKAHENCLFYLSKICFPCATPPPHHFQNYRLLI